MSKIIAKNRLAYRDYRILDKYEAGLVLKGYEVKAIREGNINLKGGYVTLKQTKKELPEVWLINANIPLYSKASVKIKYDPTRSRKLLLKKSEIKDLIGKRQEKNLTFIPLTVYSKRGRLKLTVGLGRSKKKHDKREDIKKRESDRAIQRALRQK
ncbi:SsrA-binding protein SmpB [Patescibacteria group bacterium]